MSTADPFKVVAPPAPEVPANIDWQATKAAVVARLDVAAEFAALGVEITGSKPSAKGWLECRAVGRKDDSPSAAINVRSGFYYDAGGEGLKCDLFNFALRFHGERFGRFVDAMKFYAAKAGIELGRVATQSGGRIREAEYLYRDAKGETQYCVFRYILPNGKKTFTQHPPDGRGNWKRGPGCMDGVEPLPYRLPELLTSALSDESVWIVEGEKDVERLRAEGFTATTNHQGSQSTDATWPKFAHYLKDREVYIVPDNDSAGRIHARKVAAYLHGVAGQVKVVELPGLPAKGDVSDWLDLGHAVDELGKIAHKAKVWDPADDGLSVISETTPAPTIAKEARKTEAVVVRLSDVVARPVEWLIPGKIPIGKITLIAGQPGIGKSYLTMDLIARVTTGGEIPGPSKGECIPDGSVVLLSAEDGLADTVRPRLDIAGADCTRVFALTTLRTPDGNNEPFSLGYLPLLEETVSQIGDVKLLIIDPITSYVGGKVDDHKNAQLRTMLEPLAAMAEQRNIAVVVITHLNKGASANAINRITGSLAYVALSRAAWLITRDPDERGRLFFLSIKNNLAPDPTGLAYRIIVDGGIEWEQTVINETADEILAKHSKADRGDKEGKKAATKLDPVAWLLELFQPGVTMASDDVFAKARAAGFTQDAVYNARKNKLADVIKCRKPPDYEGRWAWTYAPDVSAQSSKVQSSEVQSSPDIPF